MSDTDLNITQVKQKKNSVVNFIGYEKLNKDDIGDASTNGNITPRKDRDEDLDNVQEKPIEKIEEES
jgi:hypothetical protein